jgi:hypothetical protein
MPASPLPRITGTSSLYFKAEQSHCELAIREQKNPQEVAALKARTELREAASNLEYARHRINDLLRDPALN